MLSLENNIMHCDVNSEINTKQWRIDTTPRLEILGKIQRILDERGQPPSLLQKPLNPA
jgi:hypothetical protein